jgi:DNA-binding MarR family transcriptional regulator
VAYGEEALEKVPRMTPARFDLMYLVRRKGIELGPAEFAALKATGSTEAFGEIEQSVLRVRLGLSRATVSRMLCQLELFGWIERQPAPDRRTKLVRLTPAGLAIIWKAMRRVFRDRKMRREYEKLVPIATGEHIIEALTAVWYTLDHIARHFGDTSSVWYDFGQREDFY